MQSKIRMTPNLVQIRSVGQSRIIEQLDVHITANTNLNYNILDDILHELHEKHFPTKKCVLINVNIKSLHGLRWA